ncbi:MAG TPA: regulatory iron-sulfur-containing complex subunit RicT [Gemmatimonadaceae bacterium]|nr:regulatory iron-sulfur-containing complex subunit RicT [Gemmatimonadaceae bacterium]
MAHLIEVAFRGNRKEFFLWDYPDPPPLKAAVIVDADRGEDLGRVHSLGEQAQVRNGGCPHGCGTSAPTRKALRLANTRDRAADDELTRANDEARHKGMERVRANGLAMKLTDAEWQWDRKKLTFYFTAEKRVDFRNLVRDMAALFRTRIELKQIGVRDEAKRLDGIGRCGRQYCSASWLPELRPVNLGVAKDQRLSLNPAQISGACGRLMCCLRYEHEFYVQSRKRFPKEGKIVVTARGEEQVLSVDIFRERLTLRSVEGEARVVSLSEFNNETAAASSGSLTTGDDTIDDIEQNGSVDGSYEISPELQYTAEHEVVIARDIIVLEAASTETRSSTQPASDTGSAPEETPPSATRSGDRDDAGARRRRGRRGGRRGRGGESGDR